MSGLKSVLYVDYLVSAFLENADHVEANLLEVRLALGEVFFGDEAELSLLLRRDGLDRLPEGRASAELHLAENKRVPVAEDEVYFAVACLKIPLDERVSESFEIPKRDVLPTLAVGAAAFQRPTPAYERRCTRHGPASESAPRCSIVPYPLFRSKP